MKVAINQPTFLSWMGYYALLDVCDTFVVYDDVVFSHQSWQHRNKIRNQDSRMWLTVPIVRREGQLINEVLINHSTHWQKDHYKSIKQNYSRTLSYRQYIKAFEEIYEARWEKLVDLNMALIKEMARHLHIKMPQIIKSSDMVTSGHKTDRLIPILKELKADTYISGVAAKDYLEVEKLNEVGIGVQWFEYEHPIYPQRGEFIPYLSVLDLLFNTGDKAVEYLRQGVNLVNAREGAY